MGKTGKELTTGGEKIAINNLNDLVRLNLNTLEDVMAGDIDNKKAAIVFTGSRTVTAALKLGLEAMKLGIVEVGGVGMGTHKRIEG
jgi:hypothetical protein